VVQGEIPVAIDADIMSLQDAVTVSPVDMSLLDAVTASLVDIDAIELAGTNQNHRYRCVPPGNFLWRVASANSVASSPAPRRGRSALANSKFHR
jgi:hypothetical protein